MLLPASFRRGEKAAMATFIDLLNAGVINFLSR
jgi:hypothetical protein